MCWLDKPTNFEWIRIFFCVKYLSEADELHALFIINMQFKNKTNAKCALIHIINVLKEPSEYNFRNTPANQFKSLQAAFIEYQIQEVFIN